MNCPASITLVDTSGQTFNYHGFADIPRIMTRSIGDSPHAIVWIGWEPFSVVCGEDALAFAGRQLSLQQEVVSRPIMTASDPIPQYKFNITVKTGHGTYTADGCFITELILDAGVDQNTIAMTIQADHVRVVESMLA